MAATDTGTTTPKKAAPKRKPAAKRTTKTAARTPAAKATTRTATRRRAQPQTRAEAAQQIAERAVLIPVGAALEARDRVGEIASTYRSRTALERQLIRFERRGESARTRVEQELRRNRTRLGQRRTQVRRSLGSNAETVTHVVQNGVSLGIKLVNGAQDRLPKVA